MELINREFKAVVQDMTHVYVGAQMSVRELISYEDVPFKVKAIFNKYFGKEEQIDKTIGELLGSVKKDEFAYQVINQLKLRFKVGVYVQEKGKEKYVSKTLKPDEFFEIHASEEKFFDEEIVFNKLALLAFST